MSNKAHSFRFDEVLDRRSTNSMKWVGTHKLLEPDEIDADPLPMWLADMDFRAPQVVIDALVAAAHRGDFGYPSGATRGYVEAVTGWQKRHFNWDVSPEWVVQTSGTITTIKTIIQAFSAPGDRVLIQPPVYSHFSGDVLLTGRRPANAPLVRSTTGYDFDKSVFERAITPDTKLFILSNPHNPTGNVWTEGELRAMGEVCANHGILVVSDEIHQDLIINPIRRHVPFASLGETFERASFTCTSPSKSFNLPGLQSANVIIPNSRLRAEFLRQYERNHLPLVNTMGMVAAEAAYSHGEPWLEELLAYVRANHAHFSNALNGSNIGLNVLHADSLYLAWIDCRELGMNAETLKKFMLTKARVWFDEGQKFGQEGRGYMRANLGCPRSTIDEAIERLSVAIRTL